ncbi:hypothetical protein [Shewanella sp. S1-49-MNA-CIBAN-0167]|uniref:hypothetical protein n=1 Tax=Shewanella sp. S1-49-MNA-CIBAN-0167 TaxID=3140468 RepID=UPI003318BCEE
MKLLIGISKFLFCAIFIVLTLSLFLFPEVAEAGRGASRGGTLWWIPIVIVGGIIFFINKNTPELWTLIVAHVVLFFVSCLAAIFLKWTDFINQEDTFTAAGVIFVLIVIGLHSSGKNKKNSSK